MNDTMNGPKNDVMNKATNDAIKNKMSNSAGGAREAPEEVLEITKVPYGKVKMPPSKSYLHRAFIMAGLAGGVGSGGSSAANGVGSAGGVGVGSVADSAADGGGIDLLKNTEPLSDDTRVTLDCVKALMTQIEGPIRVNMKESGSSLRFMLPLILALEKKAEITAEGRLLDRPNEVFYDVLRKAGGSIEREGNILRVSGKLEPGLFTLPGDISSQYVSGLLMALPLLDGDSVIKLTGKLESAPYVDMTINLMERFGVNTVSSGKVFFIKGRQQYEATAYEVEGDYSAGAYFLVAGALGCQVECEGLREDSLQGDKAILHFLKKAGAFVEIKENGNILVRSDKLKGIKADISQCPDLAPPLCVLLCFCKGESRIVGGRRLIMKESNRLESISNAMNALGADVCIEGHDLKITGRESIIGGRANPAGDHRIAMAIALASIKSRGRVFLENPACVNKSYPDFFKDFCGVERKLRNE